MHVASKFMEIAIIMIMNLFKVLNICLEPKGATKFYEKLG